MAAAGGGEMSSLVSGSSILHIANRLGDMRKENIHEGEMDMSTTSPASENVPEAEPPLKFRLFKDVLKNTYSTVPTSNSTTPSTSSVEEQPQSTPPEPEEDRTTSAPPAAFDLMQAISQIQKEQQQAGGNNQSLFGTPPPELQNQSQMDNMLTMRDLLPGYSPWLRNAGRKKSHPVWDFFKDLKDTNGVGGVVCLHCNWSGDDRSPNNLRTHLKKFHTLDGIFAKFSQKLAQTPTQPYVKRARAGGSNHSQSAQNATDTMALALQQLQNASNLNSMNGALNLNGALNFLENMPKSNEVINISAGFASMKDDDLDEQNGGNDGNEPGSSGASASGERAVSGSPVEENAGGSPSVSSTNHLNAFMNMAANPLMWNALVASNSSHGSAFSLNDGQCVSVLMKMAIDLDLTMSYHKRRGDIELCFESNRTAEKSGGRGKVLCLCDMSREIRVIERVNGAPTDTEMWTKTDFNQFHWAIRGKCQKVLVKN